jgi:hypothetical protein
MKKIFSAVTMLAMLVFAACNNAPDKTAASPATDSTKDTAAAPAMKPAFKPFDVLEVTHTVKNYAKWKVGFDSDSGARKASGLEFMVIGRGMKDSNSVLIALNASDLQKARDFGASPRLKDVMKKNGVISKPEAHFFHVLQFNPDSKEKQWVTISHKVKDFDAWFKVFNDEGPAARAVYGLVDVAVARDIDDSSMVHIVFDIKDMEKAKARFADPALKKMLTDAGVIGTPKFEFYTTGE